MFLVLLTRFPDDQMTRLWMLRIRKLGSGFHRCIGSHRPHGSEKLLFAVDKITGIERCQLKTVAVGDSVSWAGFYAVTAEDAAVIVNVVDLGIAFGAADAVLFCILGGFNINAIRRAGGRAQ